MKRIWDNHGERGAVTMLKCSGVGADDQRKVGGP
jgi:hypothetical protein